MSPTPDRLYEGIAAAIKAGEFRDAFLLLHGLAKVDPARAETVHAEIQAGLNMAAGFCCPKCGGGLHDDYDCEAP